MYKNHNRQKHEDLYWPCSCQYVHCRNMTLEKEIFPAATDSRFIRAVSKTTGYNREKRGEKSPPGHSFCGVTLFGGKPFNSFPSQPGHRSVCYVHCRWVSLRSAFPPWTGHQSCCTITTSFWMRKSSWTASVYLRGSSRLLPASLPVLMRLRQILIFNPLYNILHGWSEYLTWIICRDYQREIPCLS